jgi:diphosphomevalonate decarboxylase
MTRPSVVAIAHPNIAFIKYWGNRDDSLRLPANGSISMNLEGLETRTTVHFDASLSTDQLEINGTKASETARQRASGLLNEIRRLASIHDYAHIASSNNFPTGAGIASSASAFAALALAASTAADLQLDEAALSRLARLGSGSACRSIPAGFVEWQPGTDNNDSFAHSIAPPEHWDLADCIVVVAAEHKPTGSTAGHTLAVTSPLQQARLDDAPRRLDLCRSAILTKDFQALSDVVEQDSNLMHAIMLTSEPPLMYWLPATITVMQAVRSWRQSGLPVCYTIDAGPNVHVICPSKTADQVSQRLSELVGVERVIHAKPGGPARLVNS